MKKTLLTLIIFFSGTAFAASSASDSLAQFDHHVYASLGFSPGGIAFGGEYEYPIHKTFGLGGFLRIQSKDDEKGFLAPGVTAFGAFVRPHFQRRAWDLWVAPGFGVAMIDGVSNNFDDETGIGPSFEVGVSYQLTDAFAIGAEYFQMRPWFADDWQGLAVLDGVNTKIRLGF